MSKSGVPSVEQIEIIQNALRKIPEDEAKWTISKSYTIGKLRDEIPKRLLVKTDDTGRLHVRIEMANAVTTPWALIPQEHHDLFNIL